MTDAFLDIMIDRRGIVFVALLRMIKSNSIKFHDHACAWTSCNWFAYSYIIVKENSVNMPAICKSDGDTPRLEKKRSMRMKVKVEIEKQSDKCDLRMRAKIISTACFSLEF